MTFFCRVSKIGSSGQILHVYEVYFGPDVFLPYRYRKCFSEYRTPWNKTDSVYGSFEMNMDDVFPFKKGLPKEPQKLNTPWMDLWTQYYSTIKKNTSPTQKRVKVHFMLYIIILSYCIYNHPSHCLAIFAPWLKTSISVVFLLYNHCFPSLTLLSSKMLGFAEEDFCLCSQWEKTHYWGIGEGNMGVIFGGFLHRIGWWENLQETPIFDGKNHGFL